MNRFSRRTLAPAGLASLTLLALSVPAAQADAPSTPGNGHANEHATAAHAAHPAAHGAPAASKASPSSSPSHGAKSASGRGDHHPAQSQAPSHSQSHAAGHAASPKPHPTPQPGKQHPTHPAQGSGLTPAGDPPGNNGTVKIKGIGDLGTTPNNVAHPGCDFQVMWYGFDEGPDVVSTVSFAMQAPTADVGVTVDGPTSVFVGGDPATGAGTPTGLDGSATYHLTFDGTPQAQQGYHVRLTVSTPYSNGNDTKTKVFWVAPCTSTPPTGTTGSGTTSTPSTGETTSAPTSGSVPESIAPPVSQADTLPPTVLTPTGMTSSSVVASAPVSAPATAAVASSVVASTPAARVVPTAVDAGEAGAFSQALHAWHGTALPLLVLTLGLGTTGVALRRRTHAVRG